ncbi:hypothetical protein PoB_000192400 [Plakobranchus ocellatus]|uniref:Uncharacterized protein n=1 Tax=Plakobranchus ocellatus TaxID=259542 RepID=A0AAV3XX52_9GAST|nr:hypothetical protein PoB_000192400 [Plakobranchus ocellatus]
MEKEKKLTGLEHTPLQHDRERYVSTRRLREWRVRKEILRKETSDRQEKRERKETDRGFGDAVGKRNYIAFKFVKQDQGDRKRHVVKTSSDKKGRMDRTKRKLKKASHRENSNKLIEVRISKMVKNARRVV